MRYLCLALLVVTTACAADTYGGGYPYHPRDAAYAYGYDRGYGPYGSENCGTPYEPKACPAYRARELPYYPRY
jgi:hypothetical protein